MPAIPDALRPFRPRLCPSMPASLCPFGPVRSVSLWRRLYVAIQPIRLPLLDVSLYPTVLVSVSVVSSVVVQHRPSSFGSASGPSSRRPACFPGRSGCSSHCPAIRTGFRLLFPLSGPSGHVCPVHLQTSLSPALSALFGQSAVVVAFRPLRLFPSMSWPLSGHCLCSARLNAASASGRLCAFRSAVVRPFLPLRLLSSHFRCYDCCLRPTVASAFVRPPFFPLMQPLFDYCLAACPAVFSDRRFSVVVTANFLTPPLIVSLHHRPLSDTAAIQPPLSKLFGRHCTAAATFRSLFVVRPFRPSSL